MSKKLYKLLPATILLSSVIFAAEDVGELQRIEPNERIESNIVVIHDQTIQNHEEMSNTIEYLENELNDLSVKVERAKIEYNSKIDRYSLYSVSKDAIAIYNDGVAEVFNISKKESAMKYMYNRYEKLDYTNTYFNVYDLNKTSGLSAEQFNAILKGTGCQGLGYVFSNIENQYGINGLFILAIAQQESGLGSSNMAKQKNNLTGYMAYDSNTGKARKFTSFEDCLMTTARAIEKNYLKEDGEHYYGTSVFDVNIKYCSKPEWSTSLIDIMFSSAEKIL